MKNDRKTREARFAPNESMIRYAYVYARAVRDGKKLTRSELAEQVGLNRHTLAKWEKIKGFV